MVYLRIISHSYAMAERCIGERSVKIEYRYNESINTRYIRVPENDCSGDIKERLGNRELNEGDIAKLLYEFGIIIDYQD